MIQMSIFYLNDCYVTTVISIFQHNIHYIELPQVTKEALAWYFMW